MATATNCSSAPSSALLSSPATTKTTSAPASENNGACSMMCSPCCLSRDELKKRLTPLQYQITQEKGTERAFTGKFYKLKDEGVYSCVVCGEQLFTSETKYESGSGWPAFYDVMDPKKLKLKHDLSHVGGNLLLLAMKPGLVRTEVSCAKCHSHLGHLFDDGPKPSGKRFCINSAALNFMPGDKDKEDGGGKTEDEGTTTTTSKPAPAAAAASNGEKATESAKMRFLNGNGLRS